MKFEKSYFKDSKISNYKDYCKKKYVGLAKDLINHFQITPDDRIVDFGCATGNLLYEFKKRGIHQIVGTDVSYWAINYGKKKFGLKEELQYYNINLLTEKKDYVLFLDVLEHIDTDELDHILRFAKKGLNKAIIMRVPISATKGGPYVLEISRNDKTHIQCHTTEWWTQLFAKKGYALDELLNLQNIYCSEGVFAATFRTKK